MTLYKVSREGAILKAHGVPIRLTTGINETVALAYGLQYDKVPALKYKNYLFPSPTGWGETVMPSASYRDFWHKYFWLCKYYGRKHGRLGDTNPYGFGAMWDAWHFKRPIWDEVFGQMLAMAKYHEIYVVPQIGSAGLGYSIDKVTGKYGLATKLTNPMKGDIFTVDSEAYKAIIAWLGEIMRAYKDDPAIAMWDLYNEPMLIKKADGTWLFPTIDSFRAWIVPYAKAATAQDHSHLITIGNGLGCGNPWSGWGQANFNALNDSDIDVAHDHPYGSLTGWENTATDLYWYTKKRKEWADALGKPFYIGEFGYNKKVTLDSGTVAPYSFWDEYESQCQCLRVAACAQMVLSNKRYYPPSAAVMASIPPVPP